MYKSATLAAVIRPWVRVGLLALLLGTMTAATARAQYCTRDECDECSLCACHLCCCHEPPEMWVINTRCLPRCKNLDAAYPRMSFKRYDRRRCCFVRETRESFLASEGSMPSLFYIHGNTLEHKGAMKGFWKVYEKMRCCPGKKRLVCWSWPAERVIKGFPIRKMMMDNLHLKFHYAEYQGYYLAKLVDEMSLSQRVMLSGHSYGAITAAAAAQWLGGGCLRGRTLEGAAPVERPNLRIGMISGAFDNDALLPGHRYGQAFVACEKVFVTRNINDSTLDKWPDISFRGKQAIGVTGLNARCLGQYRHKLCQVTLTEDVGRWHYLKFHLKSTRFVSMLCCLSFPECAECAMAKMGKPTKMAQSEPAQAAPEEAAPEPVVFETEIPEPAELETAELEATSTGPAEVDPAEAQDDVALEAAEKQELAADDSNNSSRSHALQSNTRHSSAKTHRSRPQKSPRLSALRRHLTLSQ